LEYYKLKDMLSMGEFPALFLTVTPLKDPDKVSKESHHTCEVFELLKQNGAELKIEQSER
jgi:hypothetical protein